VTTSGADRSVAGISAAALAMTAWAGSAVMAKGIDLPAVVIVFWRFWLYAVVIVIFVRCTSTPLTLRGLRISLWGGIALGLDVVGFFTAVKLTTIANATVIGSIQPVVMLFLVGPLFGERVRRRDFGFAGIAIIGVIIVMFGSSGLPAWSIRGDLLSVAVLVAWTSYFVFSKLTRDRISSNEYTAATALIGAVVATPFVFFAGEVGTWPDANSWFWLVLLAVGPGLLGHTLMNWSISHVQLWLLSSMTLAIPVSSTLMAWIFLDEKVVALQFLGMGVVMSALFFMVKGSGAVGVETSSEPIGPKSAMMDGGRSDDDGQ
jgi:drug/metabolite transporter (DMT)-like permease